MTDVRDAVEQLEQCLGMAQSGPHACVSVRAIDLSALLAERDALRNALGDLIRRSEGRIDYRHTNDALQALTGAPDHE